MILKNFWPGIFEKHKLLFSFQITIKLEQDQSHVSQEELDFFIKVQIQAVLVHIEENYITNRISHKLQDSVDSFIDV